MSETTVAFVEDLAARFPGLKGALEDHRKDYGEVLPHVFLADVVRYLVALTAVEGRLGEAQKLVAHFEAQFGQPELQELIAVSFVENLPGPSEPGARLRLMLGPALRTQLRLTE